MRDIVLVLTQPGDPHAEYMLPRLRSTGVRVVQYDTGEFPIASTLDAHLTTCGWQGEIVRGEEAIPLRRILSIWYRRPAAFRFAPVVPGDCIPFIRGEALMGLGGVLRSLPCRWVNHPDRLVSADYKPYQLAMAAAVGLSVPRTVVTNSPEKARAFFDECAGEVIYKTLSTGYVSSKPSDDGTVYTTSVGSADLNDAAAIQLTPCLFQERVDRISDLRVTVIGNAMSSVEIVQRGEAPTNVDWRMDYDRLEFRRYKLPDEVAERALRLVHDLGLLFAALDFVIAPTGEPVFLEANPNGQWVWLEMVSDERPSDAMVELLTRPLDPPVAGAP